VRRTVWSIALVVALVPMAGCRPQPGVPSRPEPEKVSDGYGERPREQAGGVQTATLSASDIARSSRVEELLEAKFPSLHVRRTGDGNYSVTVRSANSFLASEEVLFVIDGTPHESGRGRGLGWLNPADVVRIDLLKNPSETALYGVRGANGVIVITTRRP
jgi:TonB-dependent SusC/RagA subfamily outer membrane receptor